MIILLVVPPEIGKKAHVDEFLSFLEEKRGFDCCSVWGTSDWDRHTKGGDAKLAKERDVVAEIHLQEEVATQHVANTLGRLAGSGPVCLLGIKASDTHIDPVFNTLRGSPAVEFQAIKLLAAKSVVEGHERFGSRCLGVSGIKPPDSDEVVDYPMLAKVIGPAVRTRVPAGVQVRAQA